MKKLILFFALILAVFAVSAQQVGSAVAFVQDTTTDAETEYLVIATPVAITQNYTVGLTITPVNISGTATVTADIETSNDNSVWHSYGTSTTVNTSGTVANYSWILADYPFKYVRMKCVSSGIGVTKLNGTLILKKK